MKRKTGAEREREGEWERGKWLTLRRGGCGWKERSRNVVVTVSGRGDGGAEEKREQH